MRGFWAVFRRELAERRLIALGALLLSLAPLAAPLLAGQGHRVEDVRSGAAIILAVMVSVFLALALGSSAIGADLGERRLGFYFSRPLSGGAIWAGKMAAAAVLALGSGALVILPALLHGDGLDPGGLWGATVLWTGNLGRDFAFLAGGVLFLLLLSNALSVMARARSPWLLLDLAAALALGVGVWATATRLLAVGAFGPLALGMTAIAGALTVALAVAGAVQTVRGRTDLRRGHRLLSLILWSLVALGALGLEGYSRWVLAAEPGDLVRIERVVPAPAGSWISVRGEVAARAGYSPLFLFDTATGRFRRIESTFAMWGAVEFSRDGRRVVWLEGHRGDRPPFAVFRQDLDGRATPVSTRVWFDEPVEIAVSEDGSRLAALQNERILVHDLATGRLIAASPRLGDQTLRGHLRFPGSRRVRLYGSRQNGTDGSWEFQLQVIDFDLDTGRIEPLARLPRGEELLWSVSPDGERMMTRSAVSTIQKQRLRLVDARSGQKLADLPGGVFTGTSSFLADGRIAAASWSRGRIDLHILDAAGRPLLTRVFQGMRLRLGGQPAPGLLAFGIAVRPEHGDPASWRSMLLDLETGETRPLGVGLVPVGSPTAGPASAGSRLFLRRASEIVRFDPRTGRTEVVLRGRQGWNPRPGAAGS